MPDSILQSIIMPLSIVASFLMHRFVIDDLVCWLMASKVYLAQLTSDDVMEPMKRGAMSLWSRYNGLFPTWKVVK
jgi:hypothetical protein